MNPDRVIVGEVRGHEVIPMLNAMSQGNDGSMCTIHSNSSLSAFSKLAMYAVQAPERLNLEATNLMVANAINFVVHIGTAAGRRRGRHAPLRVLGARDRGRRGPAGDVERDLHARLRPPGRARAPRCATAR